LRAAVNFPNEANHEEALFSDIYLMAYRLLLPAQSPSALEMFSLRPGVLRITPAPQRW
jgi:hypothetical protein